MLAANCGFSSAWNAGTWPGFLSKSKSERFQMFSALWREKNGCWFSGFVQVVPYQFQVVLIDSMIYKKNWHESKQSQDFYCVIITSSRWWFQMTFLIFIPIWGRWTHFDKYFSNGLKPPTRPLFPLLYLLCRALMLGTLARTRQWGRGLDCGSDMSCKMGPPNYYEWIYP